MSHILTFEERKDIQLQMLIEVDDFCREHNIKYSLSCGTLIGAIRHKGYIPWDDDVDITMPYDDMIRFKTEFVSQNIKFCDVDTENGYEFHFPRLAHRHTFSKKGLIAEGYGICIDLYPIISCSNNREILDMHIEKAKKILKKRLALIKFRNYILRILPIPMCNFSFLSQAVRKYRDFFLSEMQDNNTDCYYYQLGGPLTIFYKNCWSFDPFKKLIRVDFEGHQFYATANYDEFLNVRYGEYMKLPPEDQRHPYHGGRYYWK